MKVIKSGFLGALALIAGLSASSQMASAATVCSHSSIISQALPTTPSSTANPFCSLGNIDFGSFSVSAGGPLVPVEVYLGSGSNFTNGVATLYFHILGANGPLDKGDIRISYIATGIMSGLTLDLGNAINTEITEVACAAAFNCGVSAIATLHVDGLDTFDSATFAPVSKLYITKDITVGENPLTGELVGGSISDFSNGHSVPEPASMALLGTGLLGLGLVARRRQKK